MPTPESEAAFAKLALARDALNEITRQLNETHLNGNRQQYLQLQKDWDVAYDRFRHATEEFAAIVDQIERPNGPAT